MRRVLDLKSTDILDYFCTFFGALTPKTEKSDRGSTSRSFKPIWCYLLSYTVAKIRQILPVFRCPAPKS